MPAGAGRGNVVAKKSIDPQHHAAVLLQTRFRICQAKALAKRKLKSAAKLQHWYIRRKTLRLFRSCNVALRKLQRRWRAYQRRKQQRLEMQRVAEEAMRRKVRTISIMS
jgi:hypothetical protein